MLCVLEQCTQRASQPPAGCIGHPSLAQTGLGAPLRVECGGQLPHAHCAPGWPGPAHAEPLRIVHWLFVGSQGRVSLAQLKSLVGVQDALR